MNHLQMNDTKTEFITFGTTHLLNKKNLDSITISDTTINSSITVKFLGVLLDETLSFKQHVAAHSKSALYGIHLIKNVRKYLTMATTKMLMCTMVLSQLDWYQLHPNKHMSYYPQTISKNSKPSCKNHL